MGKFNPWQSLVFITVQEACALYVGDDPTADEPAPETKAMARAVRESMAHLDLRPPCEVLGEWFDKPTAKNTRKNRKEICREVVKSMPTSAFMKIEIHRDEWVEWFARRNEYPDFLFPYGKPTDSEWDEWYNTRGAPTRVTEMPYHRGDPEGHQSSFDKAKGDLTYCTPAMELMFEAIAKFWEGKDVQTESPKKDAVINWLKPRIVERGIKIESQANHLADQIASVIRHPEAPTGNRRVQPKNNKQC